MLCANKYVTLTPNQMGTPPPLPDWLAQSPVMNGNQNPGLASNGLWHQGKNLFNITTNDLNSGSRMSFEVGMSTGLERLESNKPRNLSFSNGSLKHNGSEKPGCNSAVVNCKEEPSHMHQSTLKDGQCALLSGKGSSSLREDNDAKDHSVLSQQLYPQDIARRQLSADDNNADSSCQSLICNFKPVEVGVRKDLNARYRPKISGEESKLISGSTHSAITPLFEKILSASDAGRIGRLVLPKKCAEAYFPPICQPEGLPLKVQDINGKEWTFQFRFWPNNNSRMYVLEGITNCLQSLQLRAGDTVSFGRTEPEGKLILGFRKASCGPQSDQGVQAVKSGNEMHAGQHAGYQKPKHKEDLTQSHSKVNKAPGASSFIPIKRKNSMLSSKRKRERADNVDLLGLKVTLEEAQGLFRSPPRHSPCVVIIEDFKFEEYEDAPVIGRPTITIRDYLGEDIQWTQCDNCLKWRKLPYDSLLPANWTCVENAWDFERSSCEAAQELTVKQLQDLLSINNSESIGAAAFKKLQDAELDAHGPEDLEALDRFAIEGYCEVSPASTPPTSKHPRHRLGCSCIVCNQPPSGGPKHPQNCGCKVCMTVRRRFQTMMIRRGRNHTERENVIQEFKSQGNTRSSVKSDPAIEVLKSSSKVYVNGDRKVISTSVEGQIDLNTQPQREEVSTCCNSMALKKQDTPDRGVCKLGDMDPKISG
ncbi:B3 domain-containing protein Os07g0563300 isoform X2 [Beta vulgaris subsp. vulgaris]|nr:B3 domain-containing protein Os07g0563300 isoform X2 [Beta vulgaris subsp. vulgaris]